MKRRRPAGLKQYPALLKEWHPEKNGDLSPEDVTPGSSKKVWWKCSKCGHEWQAAVRHRRRRAGCPMCARRRASRESALRVQYPEIAEQWHPDKNGRLSPEDVTPGSNEIVWWKCKHGHEWQAEVQARINWPACPVCAGKGRRPKVSLRAKYPEVAEEWHPEKNGDLTPEDVTYGSHRKVWWKGKCGHEWMTEVKIRTSGHGCPDCAKTWVTPEVNLRVQCPDIAKEWHPDKNGELTPEEVTSGSGKRVWWKCSHGHEWQTKVTNRTTHGTGCPRCAGKMDVLHHNVSSHPTLAHEWHAEKNGDLNPENITQGSKKRVWWKGDCGHEWQAAVQERKRGSGCPICAGRYPTPEVNLRTQGPEIAREWHPERNGKLTPDDVTRGSHTKVWWKGKCGHEWKATVNSRTGGAGCPICAKTWATPEANLRTQYPDLAREWHPKENGQLAPEDVTHASTKKVWWTCELGHEWQAKVYNRTKGSGCPFCAGKRGLINPKVSNYPTLVRQWHREKNRGISPEDITRGSKKKLWWKCERGHEWQAAVCERTNHGTGCPYCAGQRASAEHNLSNYPALAREWHPERNGKLTPEDVTPGSNKKVWWKAACGHQWQATVKARTRGSGCPICFEKRATPEANLRVQYPEVAKQWHPEKNGLLTPEDVTHASTKKVWWTCEHGHEWEATVYNRTYGTGCPYCAGKKPSPENNLSNNPALAREWHTEKNGDLMPEHVSPGSNKKVWWKCKCGHEWKTAVSSRKRGTGCPVCARRKKHPKIDLRTLYPS